VSCLDLDGANTVTTTTIGPAAAVKLGRRVTATNIINEGTLEKHGDYTIASLKQRAGVVRTVGAAAITTCDLSGGQWQYQNTGTVATVNQTGGTWDQRSAGTAARDVTTFICSGGALFREDAVTVGATTLAAANYTAAAIA